MPFGEFLGNQGPWAACFTESTVKGVDDRIRQLRKDEYSQTPEADSITSKVK